MLTFVTGNSNKFREVQMVFPDVQQLDIDLPEIQSLDSQEIIRYKLEAARSKFPEKSLIVEDTSLVFDAWNWLPGPLVKRYLQTVGDAGLWKMASCFDNKKASAICTIGYSDGKNIEFFVWQTDGTIVEPRIESRFGRDALFQPDWYNKTFAHMTPEEKWAISHRGKALELLQNCLAA